MPQLLPDDFLQIVQPLLMNATLQNIQLFIHGVVLFSFGLVTLGQDEIPPPLHPDPLPRWGEGIN